MLFRHLDRALDLDSYHQEQMMARVDNSDLPRCAKCGGFLFLEERTIQLCSYCSENVVAKDKKPRPTKEERRV
jgi:hypothetical protein